MFTQKDLNIALERRASIPVKKSTQLKRGPVVAQDLGSLFMGEPATVISSPPGSGKTTTMVNLAAFLLRYCDLEVELWTPARAGAYALAEKIVAEVDAHEPGGDCPVELAVNGLPPPDNMIDRPKAKRRVTVRTVASAVLNQLNVALVDGGLPGHLCRPRLGLRPGRAADDGRRLRADWPGRHRRRVAVRQARRPAPHPGRGVLPVQGLPPPHDPAHLPVREGHHRGDPVPLQLPLRVQAPGCVPAPGWADPRRDRRRALRPGGDPRSLRRTTYYINGQKITMCIPKGTSVGLGIHSEFYWGGTDSGFSGCQLDGDRDGRINPYRLY